SRPTVFFMDDLGQAAPAVQATCMQLLKARRVGEKKISDHVRIIAATNFKSAKAGVFGMLEPVKSRFVSILQLEVSVDDWIKWALANDVPLPLIGFIRWKPDMLHQFKASSDMTNTPSPRTVTNVGKCQNILEAAANGGAIDPTLEFEMFKGAAGEAFATEYCGHLQLARAAFDPDAILMDPDNAPIPDSLDMRYAICGAVAMRASQKTAGRIITYANRLPEEFNVLMVRDCQARNQGFQMSKEFKKWFQDHKDVMI
ncbi:MAG: ATP-binding protein, partial [Pseudomonadota bacterium]